MARQLPVKDEVRGLVRHGRDAVATAAGVTAVIWVVTLTDWLFGGAISAFSVTPRTFWGLFGIAVMPFVHAGVWHLLANTLAGIPLAILASERRVADVWVVGVFTAITSGLTAWLLGGAGSVHIGASGVIFGLLGFVLGRGLFERRLVPIAMSMLAMFLYGGSLLTILPVVPGISWQAHLGGLVGGLLVSLLLSRNLKR